VKRILGWFLAIGMVMAVAGPRDAIALNARQMLQKLRLIDGAGSGLDADTVQGMTPAQLTAQAVAGSSATATSRANETVSAALGALLSSAYSTADAIIVGDGFCNTVDVTCNGNDFLLNCSGVVSTTSGYLTQAGELASTQLGLVVRTCRAGGCGFGGAASVAVVATCLHR
jgi:hypothetical protein